MWRSHLQLRRGRELSLLEHHHAVVDACARGHAGVGPVMSEAAGAVPALPSVRDSSTRMGPMPCPAILRAGR